MKDGFIDIHHHLLYGIDDDGPQSFQDTCDMLRAAYEDGIQAIIATPHVMPGVFPFHWEEYYQRVDEARAYCKRQVMDIEIYTGAEIFYTEVTPRFLSERRVPTLAQTSYVLVEFSPSIRFNQMAEALMDLTRRGYIPILAHVERYRCLTYFPFRAYQLKKQTKLCYQLNSASLLHGMGLIVEHFCKELLRNGLIDMVATDAHNVKTRAVCMRKAYDKLEKRFGWERAEELTRGFARRILEETGAMTGIHD